MSKLTVLRIIATIGMVTAMMAGSAGLVIIGLGYRENYTFNIMWFGGLLWIVFGIWAGRMARETE